MNKIKIFFADNSEYSETNSIAGGAKNDVIIQIDDNLYHPSFYDIFSLKQDFDRTVAVLYQLKREIMMCRINLIVSQK